MSNLRTEHEIEIDQIHDRQLAEKDAIIATMNEAHKLLIAEKDAEIERLKEHIIFLVGEIIVKNKLITELCDALEGRVSVSEYYVKKSEATR